MACVGETEGLAWGWGIKKEYYGPFLGLIIDILRGLWWWCMFLLSVCSLSYFLTGRPVVSETGEVLVAWLGEVERRRIDELIEGRIKHASEATSTFFAFRNLSHHFTKDTSDNGGFGRMKSRLGVWQIAISIFGCCRFTSRYISIIAT